MKAVLLLIAAFLSEAPLFSEANKISIDAPPYVTGGESFKVKIALVPDAERPVRVEMETGSIEYSESSFTIQPHQLKTLSAKVIHTQSGRALLHASAVGYEEARLFINAGYTGRLKLNSSETIPFESASLSILIIDSNGEPLRTVSQQRLLLESPDAELWTGSEKPSRSVTISLVPGTTISPQVSIKPTSKWGGQVHVTTTLLLNANNVLSQQTMTIIVDPAWWLPAVLAMVGGLLHAIHKVANNNKRTLRRVLVVGLTSVVAGLVGYMVASLSPFWIKSNSPFLPATYYLLIGFVCPYLGFETLFKKFLKIGD